MPIAVAFQDGLGDRRAGRDVNGGDIEVLHLRPELAAAPSFEFALRERFSRLATFRHPSFARVRSVERAGDQSAALTLTSDSAFGIRLSELLAGCEARQIPISLNVACCLIRQLVSAVAVLHEGARASAHGAIAPERLIVTPKARLVVTEYVLGSALEQLLYPADRYWTEFRIALPRVSGLAHFDHLADVTQVGAVSLALILGRPLEQDEYPGRIAELVATARGIGSNGEEEPLPKPLRLWLERALQIDTGHVLASGVDARVALDATLEECDIDLAPARLESLLIRYHDIEADGLAAVAPPLTGYASEVDLAMASGIAASGEVAPAPRESRRRFGASQDVGLSAEALFPIREPAPVAVMSVEAPATESSGLDLFPAEPTPAVAATGTIRIRPTSNEHEPALSSIMATAVVQSPEPRVANAPVLGNDAANTDVVVSPRTAEIIVSSTLRAPATTLPVRDTLFADAVVTPHSARGRIAATIAITAVLAGSGVTIAARRFLGEKRAIASDAVAGIHSAGDRPVSTPGLVDGPQSLPDPPPTLLPAALPLAAPVAVDLEAAAPVATGVLTVGSRFDVRVLEHGRQVGSSAAAITLPAGMHSLELVNDDLGYKSSRTVDVQAGRTQTTTVEAPKGTLSVNAAPWADVWIDGEARGQTPLGNLAVPIGLHDVVFKHPEFGEQQYTVTVGSTGVARLSIDLRKQ